MCEVPLVQLKTHLISDDAASNTSAFPSLLPTSRADSCMLGGQHSLECAAVSIRMNDCQVHLFFKSQLSI